MSSSLNATSHQRSSGCGWNRGESWRKSVVERSSSESQEKGFRSQPRRRCRLFRSQVAPLRSRYWLRQLLIRAGRPPRRRRRPGRSMSRPRSVRRPRACQTLLLRGRKRLWPEHLVGPARAGRARSTRPAAGWLRLGLRNRFGPGSAGSTRGPAKFCSLSLARTRAGFWRPGCRWPARRRLWPETWVQGR
jgi:hypothetical protein